MVDSWLEISMTVDGELAEAVAEVLARFTPNGVAIEATQIGIDTEGEGYPVGPLRVCGYLPRDVDVEETRQKIEEALWYLGRISPLPAPQFQVIQEVNWVEAWKEHYHPIPVGERLMVVPAWIDEFPPDRVPIRIEPGMAFGTGTHPSTQLCLAAAEHWVRPGQPVIDVGCGSGILSVAALKLGASHALGVDIDEEAMRAARQNAALNGIAERLELGLGSVAEIRSGTYSLTRAPLVFANILAPVIIRLLEAGMAKLVEPGGVLALSGLLAEQETSVLEAVQAQHFSLRQRSQSGDWVALVVSAEP